MIGSHYPRNKEAMGMVDLATFKCLQDLWRAVDDINRRLTLLIDKQYHHPEIRQYVPEELEARADG